MLALSQKVNGELKRRGVDSHEWDAERFYNTRAGLLRGARPGDTKAEERAFEQAIKASVKPKDEIAAAEAYLIRKEAERAEVNAGARAQLEAQGYDPTLAAQAVARDADNDPKALIVDEPKDEVEAAELWIARQGGASE